MPIISPVLLVVVLLLAIASSAAPHRSLHTRLSRVSSRACDASRSTVRIDGPAKRDARRFFRRSFSPLGFKQIKTSQRVLRPSESQGEQDASQRVGRYR